MKAAKAEIKSKLTRAEIAAHQEEMAAKGRNLYRFIKNSYAYLVNIVLNVSTISLICFLFHF